MQTVQLQSLLKISDSISEELSRIRNDVQQQRTCKNDPKIFPLSSIDRGCRLRQMFRQIAQAVEARRDLQQLQIQKIQKSRTFYEGLLCYKATLISKIKQSQVEAIDIIDVDIDVDDQQQVETQTRDLNQRENGFNQAIKSNKFRKEQQYQNLLKIKSEKQEIRKEKLNLYQKVVPEKAKRAYEELASLIDLKDVEPIPTLGSVKLASLYQKFNSLTVDNFISATFHQESNQLQIKIIKHKFDLYENICSNNIIIKELETKFIITSLPGDQLVVGLHRSEQFTNEQVFKRLIYDQKVKSVFAHPKNDYERDFNSQYVRVSWLQDKLLNETLSPLSMINAIKQRIFCLNLRKHMLDNIKTLSFYQIPIISQKNKHQFEITSPQIIKRSISSSTLQPIQLEQYFYEIDVPYQIETYLDKYIQMQKEMRKKGLKIQNNSDMLRFVQACQALNLEELVKSNINSYFKGFFFIHQNRVEYVLVVPFAYPKKPSKILITNWTTKTDQLKKPTIFQETLKILKISTPRIKIDSQILQFQWLVNRQIFLLTEQYQSYQILLQLNYLITLLYHHKITKQ